MIKTLLVSWAQYKYQKITCHVSSHNMVSWMLLNACWKIDKKLQVYRAYVCKYNRCHLRTVIHLCYPLYGWIIREDSCGFVIKILFSGIFWEICITEAEWIINEQISILNDDKHCVTYHRGFSAEEFPVILTINKFSILSLIYGVLLFQRRIPLTAYQCSSCLFLVYAKVYNSQLLSSCYV